MKKIVNGKLYDTNEAISICSWRRTDTLFGVEVEVQFTLFRKKVAENPLEDLKLSPYEGVSDWAVKKDESKGEFFLAVQIAGIYNGKGRIQPLSVDEAIHIFEEHTDADFDVENKYERYFGIRPQKSLLEQIKEAFKAGAEAKQKQYEEEKAKKGSEEVQ